MGNISEELERIENELSRVITGGNPVLDELNVFISNSSKMIRSRLAILYLKSNNIPVNDNVIKLLAAGELIHNASLLHDDIIDNSEKRRGKDTLGKMFSPKISILCGDLLVSKGVKIIHGIDNDEITEIFADCIDKMCNAEIKQYLLRGTIPSDSDYIDVCRGKTAELFKSILKSVSILTNNDSDIAVELGLNFGILFQLQNDISPQSAENDVKNEIKTAVDIYGIEKTKYLIDNYKKKIESLIELFPNKVYAQSILGLI